MQGSFCSSIIEIHIDKGLFSVYSDDCYLDLFLTNSRYNYCGYATLGRSRLALKSKSAQHEYQQYTHSSGVSLLGNELSCRMLWTQYLLIHGVGVGLLDLLNDFSFFHQILFPALLRLGFSNV